MDIEELVKLEGKENAKMQIKSGLSLLFVINKMIDDCNSVDEVRGAVLRLAGFLAQDLSKIDDII